MLDRLKGARTDQTDAEASKGNQAKADDGMPRFQPQPGGFGRRAVPVGTTPAGATNVIAAPAGTATVGTAPGSGAPADTAPRTATIQIMTDPKAFDAAPTASAQPQFRKPEQRPAASANANTTANGGWAASAAAEAMPALGDISTRIADWLMREMKDGRGIHCETLLTAIGALAGYSAQQALWEGMVKPGKLAIARHSRSMETPSGAIYFFGDALDQPAGLDRAEAPVDLEDRGGRRALRRRRASARNGRPAAPLRGDGGHRGSSACRACRTIICPASCRARRSSGSGRARACCWHWRPR